MKTEQLRELASRAPQSAPDTVGHICQCLDQFDDKDLDLDQVVDAMGAIIVDWLASLGLLPEDPLFTYVAVWLGNEFCKHVLGKKDIIRRDLSELRDDTFGSGREILWVNPKILATHQFLVPISSARAKTETSKYWKTGSMIFDHLDSEFHDRIIWYE